MKTKNLFLGALIALGLTACIPSLHPFYQEKDLVFDPRLLGEWQEKGETNDVEMWAFERASTNAYKLTVTEKDGKRGQFSAHLFKLKSEYFLDIIPTECEMSPSQAEWVALAMFPGHLLLRVTQMEPELKLAAFNYDKLAKLLEENPRVIAHHTENERIILTGNTSALQRFVMARLAEGELFDKPGEMIRKTPTR